MTDQTPSAESERDRPGVMGWFARHPKTSVALCFLIVAVLAVFGLDQKANRSLAGRIAALRAKGEPMTVQDLIARQPKIPDEQNMTVALLRQDAASNGIKVPEEMVSKLPLVGNLVAPLSGTRWKPEQLDSARWYLGKTKAQQEAIHQACALKQSSMNVKWTQPMLNSYSALTSDLSNIRQVARLVNLAALAYAHEGDQIGAETAILDALHIPRALNGSDNLIGALVQISTQAMALDTLERCINLCVIPESVLSKVQTELIGYEKTADYRACFQGERVAFLDNLSIKGVASALAQLPPAQNSIWWSYVPVIPTLDIKAGLEMHTDLVTAMDKPDSRMLAAVQAVKARVAALPPYCVLSKILIPSMYRSVVLWVRIAGESLAMQAAIAAERFRLATGHWPDNVGALVPKYLSVIPLDPIDGKTIRYAIIPEGIKTWSICDDSNNQDDGGDVRRINKSKQSDRPKDYGWVILNPELRGKMPTSQPASGH